MLAGNGLRKYAEIFLDALGEQCSMADESLWRPGAARTLRRLRRLSAETRAAALAGGPRRAAAHLHAALRCRGERGRPCRGDGSDAGQRRGGRRCRRERHRRSETCSPRTSRRLGHRARVVSRSVDAAGMFAEELAAPDRAYCGRRGGRVGAHRGLRRRHGGRYRRAPHEPRGRCGVAGAQVSGDSCSGRRASARSSLGATRLTLEVRSSNEPAIALYRSAGFVEVGVRPGYYPEARTP